jgi:hypothetical protein
VPEISGQGTLEEREESSTDRKITSTINEKKKKKEKAIGTVH